MRCTSQVFKPTASLFLRRSGRHTFWPSPSRPDTGASLIKVAITSRLRLRPVRFAGSCFDGHPERRGVPARHLQPAQSPHSVRTGSVEASSTSPTTVWAVQEAVSLSRPATRSARIAAPRAPGAAESGHNFDQGGPRRPDACARPLALAPAGARRPSCQRPPPDRCGLLGMHSEPRGAAFRRPSVRSRPPPGPFSRARCMRWALPNPSTAPAATPGLRPAACSPGWEPGCSYTTTFASPAQSL